jgi:hypothetical protein
MHAASLLNRLLAHAQHPFRNMMQKRITRSSSALFHPPAMATK